MSIVVRKARKSYVCDGCGRIIQVGTEYLDDVVIKYGSVVHHKRYHDECPALTAAEWLFKRIMAADGDLICSEPNGDKHHIIGIRFTSGAPYALVKDWDEGLSIQHMDTIESWIDENGERILQKR